MKAIDFVKIIRKVIREEVRTVVKEELKAFKPTIVEAKKKPAPIQAVQQPVRKTPLVSFDGALADILNETAQSMMSNPEEESWPDMNGGPITSEYAQTTRPQSSYNFSGDPTDQYVRDYSSVMKAADAKAQGYR